MVRWIQRISILVIKKKDGSDGSTDKYFSYKKKRWIRWIQRISILVIKKKEMDKYFSYKKKKDGPMDKYFSYKKKKDGSDG
jgi:hypothetical protein